MIVKKRLKNLIVLFVNRDICKFSVCKACNQGMRRYLERLNGFEEGTKRRIGEYILSELRKIKITENLK